MNFLKNPYVKWVIIAFLLLIIVYDLFLFLKRGTPPPPPPPEIETSLAPAEYQESGKYLYELAKEVRDPFRGEESKVWELQEAIKIERMELELLKTKLEKKKIEQELYGISSRRNTPIGKPKVKAVLWTDKKKTALLEYRGKEFPVEEGDKVGEYRVTRIERKGVFLSFKGKETFYSVHPPY